MPKSQKNGTSFCTPGFLPSDDAIRNFQPSENCAPNQLAQQSCSQTQNSRHKNLAPWLAKTARSRKKETFSGPAQVLPFPRQQNVPLFLWRATMIHSFPQKSKTKTTPPISPLTPSPHTPRHSRLRRASAAAFACTDLPLPSPDRPRTVTRRRLDSLAPRADGPPSASTMAFGSGNVTPVPSQILEISGCHQELSPTGIVQFWREVAAPLPFRRRRLLLLCGGGCSLLSEEGTAPSPRRRRLR